MGYVEIPSQYGVLEVDNAYIDNKLLNLTNNGYGCNGDCFFFL